MDTERLLGRLEEQAKWMANKLGEIDRKVDSLVAFKWKMLGAAGLMAFVATLAAEIYRH